MYFFYNWINRLFSEENKVPKTLFEDIKVAGPPHTNNLKQYKTVLSFKVTLFMKFSE